MPAACQPRRSSLAPRCISSILCLLALSFMLACSVLMCINCYCRMFEEVNIDEHSHYSCAERLHVLSYSLCCRFLFVECSSFLGKQKGIIKIVPPVLVSNSYLQLERSSGMLGLTWSSVNSFNIDGIAFANIDNDNLQKYLYPHLVKLHCVVILFPPVFCRLFNNSFLRLYYSIILFQHNSTLQ